MAIASTTLREKSGYPSLDSDDDQGIKKTGSPKCSSHKDRFSEVLVAQGVNLVHEGMPVHQHHPSTILTSSSLDDRQLSLVLTWPSQWHASARIAQRRERRSLI